MPTVRSLAIGGAASLPVLPLHAEHLAEDDDPLITNGHQVAIDCIQSIQVYLIAGWRGEAQKILHPEPGPR